jgi:hypothetical protein
MTPEEKELEIQHAMAHLSDLIPYDDPEYDEKLRRMAEAAVRPWDDDLIALCEEHDNMIDEFELGL